MASLRRSWLHGGRKGLEYIFYAQEDQGCFRHQCARDGSTRNYKDIPKRKSHEEAGEWQVIHSTTELYAKPVRFEVTSRLQMVIVDSQDNPIETISLKRQMSGQIQQIARQIGISPELLVQNWL